MSLRDQLQDIYEKHGKLTPPLVVDTARDPEHPLHDRFEWDDAIAGEKWRREQAHELIRSVKIVRKDDDGKAIGPEVRVYHAIRGNEGVVYEPVERITTDPFLSRLLMADMEREWKTLRTRYERFNEFWQMVQADTEVLRKVS